MITETIAAIATPISTGGIGIIRISGDDSIDLIDSIFHSKSGISIKDSKTYTAHFGYIYDQDVLLDECIVLIMRKPHSYTMEDVVEIQCHGGIVVMKKILDCVLCSGARTAQPGEFTKRAFLNGRIDLSEAEAVMDLIESKNEFALSSSVSQMTGSLSRLVKDLRKKLIYHIAFIESALDDPEHYQLDGFSDQLYSTISSINLKLDEFIRSYNNGKILKEGIHTVIVGKPNAGKSSILNTLLGEERAIVTDIAGTTRDTLEETIQIDGIPLNIIDTAGIRDTENVIEKIGVDKAKNAIEHADLILYVIDISVPLSKEDHEIIDLIKDRQVIVLLNKKDLKSCICDEELKLAHFKHIVSISAKSGEGLTELYDKINQIFFDGSISFNDQVYLTNVRHKEAVASAKRSLELVMKSIKSGISEDFFTIDLMDAYEQLGFIIGESVDDDLMNEIFSEFCMGK